MGKPRKTGWGRQAEVWKGQAAGFEVKQEGRKDESLKVSMPGGQAGSPGPESIGSGNHGRWWLDSA